jgi:hypothetical protein
VTARPGRRQQGEGLDLGAGDEGVAEAGAAEAEEGGDEGGLVGRLAAELDLGELAARRGRPGRVWPLREPGVRRLVCRRYEGGLSKEEWAQILPQEHGVELCGSQ